MTNFNDDDDEEEKGSETRIVTLPAQVLAPPGPAAKAGYLMVVSSGAVGVGGQLFKLSVPKMTVGRAPGAEIRIDDDGISRNHATFVSTGPGQFRIEDLGSRNGTFVNGERITSAELKDGDKVSVGSTAVLLFSLQDEAEEQFTARMFEAATHDGLTRLVNKNFFNNELAKEISYSARYRSPLSLLMIDVDHFKRINDTHGHPVGDQVLVRLANRLTQMIRKEDVVARYGGEEFVALLRQADLPSARICAERCRAAIEGLSIKAGPATVPVTISIGVTSVPPGMMAIRDVMIAKADANLYQAKHGGRNQVVASLYEP